MDYPHNLEGFGVEIGNYTFKDVHDWLFHMNSPGEIFKAQPTYFLSECSFVIIAFIALIHAFIIGGRWKYVWLGCYFHGMTTEMVSFWMPDIDNYWHSQTTIIMLGRRLPFHIPLIYPSFMYHAAYMVAHAKLPRWAEPMAAGLVEVLIDIPYDIMAVKFVHWTWHDTDPNIYDRHYWVPWNSYYFHLTFGTAFNFALHFWRRKITGNDDKDKASSVGKEVLCSLLAGLCGMPGGVIQFLFLYHPLHDTFGIHTENCVITILVIYFLIVWTADRSPRPTARRHKGEGLHWSVFLVVFNMVLHYGLYFGMALFGSPENEVSIGLHERTGPCDDKTKVYTAIGRMRKNTWDKITQVLNASFPETCRSKQEVEKKWWALKAQGREELCAYRKALTGTGGGPPPKSLSEIAVAVEAILGATNTVISGMESSMDSTLQKFGNEEEATIICDINFEDEEALWIPTTPNQPQSLSASTEPAKLSTSFTTPSNLIRVITQSTSKKAPTPSTYTQAQNPSTSTQPPTLSTSASSFTHTPTPSTSTQPPTLSTSTSSFTHTPTPSTSTQPPTLSTSASSFTHTPTPSTSTQPPTLSTSTQPPTLSTSTFIFTHPPTPSTSTQPPAITKSHRLLGSSAKRSLFPLPENIFQAKKQKAELELLEAKKKLLQKQKERLMN